MDNENNYLSYGELLLQMSLAGNSKVVKSAITLSAKVTAVEGDTFTFSVGGSDPTPQVGDVIHQAGKTACIVEFPSLTEIKIDTTGEIANGPANLLHSETVPKAYGEQLIKQAMDLIDERTGQFFNKRTATVKLEGNNTSLMHFPVPIISIDELLINSTKTELKEGEDFDYVAFTGRQRPQDDRRNPRIKLNIGRGRGDIYSGSLVSRVFRKGTLSQFTGSFGFLEPDGSTPALVKKAVTILVMEDVSEPVGKTQSTTTGAGPLKRLKVDLHEKEFFESSQNKASVNSSDSGNEEVDRIIALYRSPIRISGSIRFYSDYDEGGTKYTY